MNIADFHIATIRAGQFDEHKEDDALSTVRYDQKTYYYDLTGMGIDAHQFECFIAEAWDTDFGDFEVTEAEAGVFDAALD